MNIRFVHIASFILPLITLISVAQAQPEEHLTLDQAMDLAARNNHLLKIKSLQVNEKQAKLDEDRVRLFPSLVLSSTYQYNEHVGELTIAEGSFGALPLSPQTIIPLPDRDKSFVLGKHDTQNAGVVVYQPLTQLPKIISGINVDRTDIRIAEHERSQVELQIRQAVEKLYYGVLIVRKQKEEAQAKLDHAKARLSEVASAVAAGKTVNASEVGMQADVADEEQNLMKLDIQETDYLTDLKQLTGIQTDRLILEEVPFEVTRGYNPEEQEDSALSRNHELKAAELGQVKATLALTAARQGLMPDVGIIAGYMYQKGTEIYPKENRFAGINLKWDLQGLVSSTQVLRERRYAQLQARENAANQREQVSNNVTKACRRIEQAAKLVAVAEKASKYRREDFRLQSDRMAAGLGIESELMDKKSSLAKAEADLLAAQLNYDLAVTDLEMLTGGHR